MIGTASLAFCSLILGPPHVMANKLRTRQGAAGATATATATAAQVIVDAKAKQTSNEKAKPVLTRKSSRINKTDDDVQDPKDGNTVKGKKTEKKSLKRRKNVTLDGAEAEEDTEKENVPPPKAAHNANGQLGARIIEAESNRDLVQAPVAKKRKWSKPTREIKLEDPEEEREEVEEEEVVDNESSSQDDPEDVASTKDDSDTEYKDKESGSRQARERKVAATPKPRRGQEAEMSEYGEFISGRIFTSL